MVFRSLTAQLTNPPVGGTVAILPVKVLGRDEIGLLRFTETKALLIVPHQINLNSMEHLYPCMSSDIS